MVCVIVNTVILAMNNIVKGEEAVELMNTLNLVFTIVFTVELGSKLFALGAKQHFKDTMNVLDCVVVIIS